VIGGPNLPDDRPPAPEPIDYETAVREILKKRQRRRVSGVSPKARGLDPRPTSPGQVLLLGVILVLVGAFVHVLHVCLLIGLAVLLIGFLSGLIQPKGRQVTWRNRDIVLPADKHPAHRLYWILYRHTGPPN